jgi:flagellar motor switch protein FliM
MDQMVSSTYLSKMDIPTVAFLFNQPSIGDWALMHFDLDFCVNIVEYLSGNKRLHSKVGKRPLTTIEQRVMHHVADLLMEEVRKVLNSILLIESYPITFISDFSGLRALSNKWIGLRIRYEISYLDKRSTFEVIYSYDHLEQEVDVPSKTVADEKDIDERERVSRSRLEVSLKKTDVELTAVLGTTKMPLRQVLGLKKDDIITLDQKISQPLDVRVSGKTKFTAYPGRRGYNYAMRIFSVRED